MASTPLAWRDLLLKPEHLAFALPGFIGRFPLAMRTLGCILLIQGITGEYGLAGLVGAVQTLLSAVARPAIGRLADRRGTRLIVGWALLVHAVGIVTLILTAYGDAPVVFLLTASAVIGASSVPYGSFSRARWPRHVTNERDLDRAYALEGMVEEVSFIVGPALVVFLSLEVTPSLGLIVSLVMTTVASLGLLRLPDLAPHGTGFESTRIHATLQNPIVLIASGTFLGMGVIFGSIELALVAFAEELGSAGMASVLIALFTVGSLVAAIVYGMISWSIPLRHRLMLCVAWLGVWMLPTAFAPSMMTMIACVMLAGIGIAPAAISASSLIQRGVSSNSLTEAFAWFGSAAATGAALGAMLAGIAIDEWGSDGGQAISVLGGILAIVVAIVGQGRLAQAESVTS